MKVLDLFSGIGGFSIGLERAGFETVAFCEIEEYPRKVLKQHWPDVPIYDDVRTLTAEKLHHDGITVDVICGGFPCQDLSVAGKQAGIKEGTRSGLWSECARLLGEIRPQYAIFENVTALLSGDNGRWFQRVLGDISALGYDAEWHCIPASELGAHHHRDRVWIIAYPSELFGYGCDTNGENGKPQTQQFRSSGSSNNMADPESERIQRLGTGREQKPRTHGKPLLSVRPSETGRYAEWEIEPNVGRVVDGVPNRAHRIKALGNAVVPQIPELIGSAINEAR